MMIPVEFVIEGPPISSQTRNRRQLKDWIRRVRIAATSRWMAGEPPVNDSNLTVKITYYYNSVAPDVDNIVKPIQDALKGLVYVDDSQVTDSISRKRNINGSFRIKGLSPVLADAFVACEEFIHVKVDHTESLEELC